ncbi:MAG: hypothetical protein KBT31_06925 [Firmicutes bacterium]|nr:hypothetical protein [Candidatus Colimorpha enterica]
MKRILSTMLVLAMVFALCVAAFAAVDTGKATCADVDNIGPFKDPAKKNSVTFTTDGEISFKNPAEDNTGCDCFIRADMSFKEAYGSKFALAFELMLNKIDGDTTKNPIFMIQIKGKTSGWDANYKFFTITGNGEGGYNLADGKNEAATKTALKTDTWYQFVIHFDLDADTATVVGGEYGKTYTTLYVCKGMNLTGDIPCMMIGQGDEKDGWKYDYLMDSLRLFSTSTSFEDGVNGTPYDGSIFTTKGKNNSGKADCYYKVVTDGVPSNKYMYFKQDGTNAASIDASLWIGGAGKESYESGNVPLTEAFGKTFKIELDYNVIAQATGKYQDSENPSKFGFETKSKSGWFNKALPAEAGWHHLVYTVDYDAGNFKVEVDGASVAEKTGDTGTTNYEWFRVGSKYSRTEASMEYKVDNIKVTPAEGDAIVVDFESANVGDTTVGVAYAKFAHNTKDESENPVLGVYVKEDAGVVATESYLAAKDDNAEQEAEKTDAMFFTGRADGLDKIVGNCFKYYFKYIDANVGSSDKLGIEWNAEGWVTPHLPAASEWTEAELVVDGVNGTWTLNVAGAKVENGTFDPAKMAAGQSIKLGINNERDNNAFDFAIDDVFVTPIFCEAAAEETSTAEDTTTAAATTAPDAPVNPGTGSVAGFIALVTVIAIGTGVVVSKKH